jgi:5-methylcytosine-specific restriction endonuclease McrA
MQCLCNPDHVYKTKKSFDTHFLTKRHIDWTQIPHEVIARRAQRNVSERIKKEVAAKAHWKCEICFTLLTANYEIDHITALYLGGTNNKENLQAICSECHRTKTREEYEDYLFAKQAYEAYMK